MALLPEDTIYAREYEESMNTTKIEKMQELHSRLFDLFNEYPDVFNGVDLIGILEVFKLNLYEQIASGKMRLTK